MPLSAVCGRAEIMDAAPPGGLGGTYAGNPLSVASALAVLDVIAEEGLVERSAVLGKQLMAHLERLRKEVPQIAEIRGLGSMVAVEFMKPGTQEADADFTKAVQAEALKRGLLLLSCGIYGNAIRFLYPLTIPDPLMQEALQILSASMQAAAAR
jgi:4-aminobutyrate aminotransferase/4-aminobutyrate aminotransferase/(S)-3-amino-2-methylpropionate transaminase